MSSIEIEFSYNQAVTIVQAKSSDLFQVVIERYYQKAMIPKDSVYFLLNGTVIAPEKTVASYMTNNTTKLNVLVNAFFKEKYNIIQESKDIICPECKEPCMLKIDDYHITLYDCRNGHTIKGIKIDEFKKTQEINTSTIKCDHCKIKNKANTEEFFYCPTCKTNICLLCKGNHNYKHMPINYDQKNYVCKEHNEQYVQYCKECCKNICYSCEHQEHEVINLKQIRPDITKTQNKLKEMKKEKEQFINNIQKIITMLKDLIKTINTFYDINDNIMTKYDSKYRNYEVYQNINEINNNNIIIEKMNNINNNNNIKDKLNDIMDLYTNINKNIPKQIIKKTEYSNVITMNYNIGNENIIKILGKTFVDNNKDKCKIIVEGIKKELTEYLELTNEQKIKKTIELKLIDIENVTNMSYMFDGCSSLNKLPDISKWGTQNVTNTRSMFDGCLKLKDIPKIKK